MKRIHILIVLSLAFLQGTPSSAHGQDPLALEDHPGGPWMGMPPAPAQSGPDPAWSVRTGLRKGVLDQTLSDEVRSGPDVAVLQNGLSGPWPALLAGFSESSVPAGPGDVAGLFPLKPVLVVPSGGLKGLRSSVFFQAGLAEYVRSGGVLLCFSQHAGADLVSLPVPESSKTGITGAGWSEDSGPLFQASLLQASHPALVSQRKTVPSVETDGFLLTAPKDGQVLLSRSDGHATLLVYPFGNGWVAVTTLMSDYSFARGQLADDERDLVRDLVLWAKSGGKVKVTTPGAPIAANLRISGPEQGIAASVAVRLVGPTPDDRRGETIFPLNVAAGQTALFSYSSTFPRDVRPGIYHLEYRLFNDQKRALSHFGESAEGWFTVPSKTALSAMPSPDTPLAPAPLRISVLPTVSDNGGGTRLHLDIRRTGGSSPSYNLFARAAGQEKHFKLTGDRTEVIFDMARSADGSPVPYAVYYAGGRSLARGGVDGEPRAAGSVMFDRPWYRSGEKARVSVTRMGSGAFTLSGLGSEMNEHISSNSSFELIIPNGLPSGIFPVAWTFQAMTGGQREGTAAVAVNGAEVRCTDIRWEPGTGKQAQAFLRLQASAGIAAVIRIHLTDPAGKQRAEHTKKIKVDPGTSEVSLSLPFDADQPGIWQLRCEIAAELPEGPGFPQEPMPLTSGRLFFDAGETAILALATDKPVYYEARGPVVISAKAYVRSKASLELLVDDKRVEREKISKTGLATISFTLNRLRQGIHRISAAASGSGPDNRRETILTYGARLPDLTVTIQTSAIKAPAMEIGVGVSNQGKVASGKATAVLYEGDPSKGGRRITHFAVPPLDPGKQHVIVVPWNLAGKAGARKLTAVVDDENEVLETDKNNNSSTLALDIPNILLEVIPRQESFAADGEIAYAIEVANFTAETIPQLTLAVHLTDPAGKTVSTESLPVTNFESGGIRRFDRMLGGVPREGVYLVEAQMDENDKTRASASVGLVIRRTLSVKGSLAGTAPAAAPCQPFVVNYAVRNGGNIPLTSGAVKIEIRSAGIGQLVYAIQLPLVAGEQTHRIAKVDFPNGDYRVSLRASAISQPSGMQGDFLIDEQALSVRGPVVITPVTTPLPRLLVWTSGESETSIERALSEKLLREAFEEDVIYSKVITSAEAFSREALTGLYNMYLLIDIDSTLDTAETLRAVLERGHVVVLAGSNDRSRSLAEQFGFQYSPASDTGQITFPAGSPLGLNGTLPYGKPAFSASRKGSQPLAVYSGDRPAVLAAPEGAGKLIAMPFSLIRSALATGTSTPYSLLVRAIIFNMAPRPTPGDPVSAGQFSVVAPAGQVAARISAPLPDGADLLWANRKNTVKNSTVVFDLTADRQPERIIYLFQAGKPGAAKKTIEVQYQCDGSFVSQGKAE